MLLGNKLKLAHRTWLAELDALFATFQWCAFREHF
jgi:hypothetical protein